MYKYYKFELDPNIYSEKLFYRAASLSRFSYNWALSHRIELYHSDDTCKFTTYNKQDKLFNSYKKSTFIWMYDFSKCIHQNALKNLDAAFSNFREKRASFPKFKNKGKCKDSFTITGADRIKILAHGVFLSKLGNIRTKEVLIDKVKGKILSATVSRKADKWFVSICTEQEVEDPTPVKGPKVGIDVGIKTFATLSDGTAITAPNPLEKNLAKLKKLQRQLSKKVVGSENYKKQAMKVAKLHAHIANIRKDFLDKATTKLAKTKSIIVVEDLKVKNMIRNRKLSRRISDQGWGMFKTMLAYKCKRYGSKIVLADTYYPSSKTCSNCGYKVDKLTLSERVFNCPNCNIVLDRDLNASINLERYPGCQENPASIKEAETLAENTQQNNSTSKDELSSMQYSLKQEVAT